MSDMGGGGRGRDGQRLVGAVLAAASLATLLPAAQAGALSPDAGERRALEVLQERRASLGLSRADVGDIEITARVYDEDTSTTHVHLRQLVDGVPVPDGVMNISIGRDGRVVTLGDRFVERLAERIGPDQPLLTPAQGVQAAAGSVGLPAHRRLEVVGPTAGPDRKTTFAAGGPSAQPIEAALAWVRERGGDLRLAWRTTLHEEAGDGAWDVAVDARTGDRLDVESLSHDADGATYEAFAPPLPRPGERTIIADPADPVASPHGWHDLDGAAGPDTTETRGINAHAGRLNTATGVVAPGSEAQGGPDLAFRAPLDLSIDPPADRQAAVINLFTWVNHAHDVLYRHGFDEDAANFQQVNRSGEGQGGDPIIALAHPSNGVGNISVTPEGQSPVTRLGVTVRPAFQTRIEVPSVDVRLGTIDWEGPTGAVATGPGVVFDDGVAPTDDGCQDSAQDLSGAVVIVGVSAACFADTVMQRLHDAGAAAVIVKDFDSHTSTTIPVAIIEAPEPDWLIARLPTTLTVRNYAQGSPIGDKALDNQVVVHEVGHGVSGRLVGGGSNTGCQGSDERMGEGWSDILALILTAQGAGVADRTVAFATHSSGEAADGPGSRRLPYSTRLDQSPFVYDDIKIKQQTHFQGMRWAAALWQVYWELVDAHGWTADLTAPYSAAGNVLALRLILDGMKLTKCQPGFVDARDAVLLADQNLTGGANQCAIWRGFAARGLGSNAVQGSSLNFRDNSQGFENPAVACASPAPDTAESDDGAPVVVGPPGVLANDGEIGDAVAELVSSPQHGTVELAPDGSYTYAPAAGFDGTDEFTYRLRDGNAVSPNVRVSIVVDIPDVTSLVADPLVLEIHGGLSVPMGTARAKLTAARDGAVLAGKPVSFLADGQALCAATTDAAGVASCSFGLVGTLKAVLGGGRYEARFAGDDAHAPSQSTAPIVRVLRLRMF